MREICFDHACAKAVRIVHNVAYLYSKVFTRCCLVLSRAHVRMQEARKRDVEEAEAEARQQKLHMAGV
eukprot:COSAG05_NODE_20238_length_281_cov_0.725275_1_plen_67_part_10